MLSIWSGTKFSIREYFNSLPNDKILVKLKLKAFAEDKSKYSGKNQNLFWQGLKTLWEKEKMVSHNVPTISHNVFKRLFSHGC